MLEVCAVESATATLEIRHVGVWNVGLRWEMRVKAIRHGGSDGRWETSWSLGIRDVAAGCVRGPLELRRQA
jgi:hypothetical protein